jgi:hypothetical protein
METTEGVEVDPFYHLKSVVTVEGSEGIPNASVSVTTGRAIEYGEVKCSTTVRIVCPQEEKWIDLAGELAFTKSLELTNDGMSIMTPGTERLE